MANVIETENVVGMVMRINDCMDAVDARTQQLQTNLRGCVNQQIALRGTDHDRAAATLITRIGRAASFAITAQQRHPG
jgi:hypothetical protein